MDLFLSAILCFNTKLIREKKDCKQADHSELIAIGKNTRFFFPHSKKSHKETSGIVLTKGGGNHSSEILSSRKKLKIHLPNTPESKFKMRRAFFLFFKNCSTVFFFANTTHLAVTENL